MQIYTEDRIADVSSSRYKVAHDAQNAALTRDISRWVIVSVYLTITK